MDTRSTRFPKLSTGLGWGGGRDAESAYALEGVLIPESVYPKILLVSKLLRDLSLALLTHKMVFVIIGGQDEEEAVHSIIKIILWSFQPLIDSCKVMAQEPLLDSE